MSFHFPISAPFHWFDLSFKMHLSSPPLWKLLWFSGNALLHIALSIGVTVYWICNLHLDIHLHICSIRLTATSLLFISPWLSQLYLAYGRLPLSTYLMNEKINEWIDGWMDGWMNTFSFSREGRERLTCFEYRFVSLQILLASLVLGMCTNCFLNWSEMHSTLIKWNKFNYLLRIFLGLKTMIKSMYLLKF